MDTVKIYFNPSYIDNLPTYMMYIPDIGMYLINFKFEKFILDQILFKLDDSNSDSYAGCRGFEKVVDIKTNGDVIWNPPYTEEEYRKKISIKVYDEINRYNEFYKYNVFGDININKVYYYLQMIFKNLKVE